mgnify:CR=1 FL=1
MTTDKRSPYVDAYLRFLHLAAAVKAFPGMDNFGVNERALFEEILMAWAYRQPLSVKEAIGIVRLGSPATLHKRVLRLREMQLIDVQSTDTDRRTKLLIPTNRGLEYAGRLGHAILGSLNGS